MLLVIAGLALGAGPASAQVEPHNTAPPPCVNCDGGSSSSSSSTTTGSSSTTEDTGSSVLPSSTERVPGTDGTGGGTSVGGTGTSRGALSRTGSDVAPQLLLAGGLLLCGTLVSIAARRRRRNAFV